MTTETITTQFKLDDVISRLDKTYELAYVDYRDSLDEHLDAVQKAIHAQDKFLIEDELDLYEWYIDSIDASVDYIIKELADDLRREYDEEYAGEIDDFIEENRDEIRWAIEERDQSNTLRDLLRNTADTPVFYDLAVDIDDSTFDNTTRKESLKKIKRALKIKGKDHDNRLLMMIDQACYGGRLVVFFTGDLENLLDLEGANTVTFKNPAIAIIDTYNGSGDDTELSGHEFTTPFDPTNLFIDKTIKYNYSFAVCGMSSGWADCTQPSFTKTTKTTSKPKKSSLHAELDVESLYNAAYKAGECTAGDMDIHRHRHTYYDNNFPCGTHCKDCGTFWID